MILDEPGPSKATEEAAVEPRRSSVSTDSPPPYIQHVENVLHLKGALRRKRRRRVRIIIITVFVIYTIVLVAVMSKQPWRKHWTPLHFTPPLNSDVDPWSQVLPSPLVLSLPPFVATNDSSSSTCNKWSFASPNSLQLWHSYPSNTTSFYINNLATSNGLAGTFAVRSSSSQKSGYVVQIILRGDFSDQYAPAEVCFAKGQAKGSYGIAIYNTQNVSSAGAVDVSIEMTVPVGVTLPTLSTYLPRFAQSIGGRNQGNFSLGVVSLDGPVPYLSVLTGKAKQFAVETVGAFAGSLSVSELLYIKSVGASPISANVTLLSQGKTLSVELESNHAPIDAFIRVTDLNVSDLSSTQKAPIPFIVKATTTHAPLNISFTYPYSNPPLALLLNATTALAPLHISAPAGFSGSFDFQAISSYAELIPPPASNGTLSRTLNFDSSEPYEVKGDITFDLPSPPYGGIPPEAPVGPTVPAESVVLDEVPSRRRRDDFQLRGAAERGIVSEGELLGTTRSAKAIIDFGDPYALDSSLEHWRSGCIVNA